MDLSNSSPETLQRSAAVDGASVAALARVAFELRGIAALGEIMAAVADVESPEAAALVGDVVSALSAAFRADLFAPAGYAGLSGTAVPHAAALFDILLFSTFGDEPASPSALSEAGVICFAACLSAAGAHEQAAALLAEAVDYHGNAAFGYAAWMARCRWAGCSDRIGDYWEAVIDRFPDPQAAEAGIDERPMDVLAYRAAARFAMATPQFQEAGNVLAIALSLPIGESEKIALADELALLAAVAIIRHDRALFDQPRLRWALGISPGVAAAAAAIVERRVADESIPFLSEAESAEAAALLRAFADAPKGGKQAITGYPMRNGRPHVDIVWLEITNHCNQKCTFCPDMFREDARTWLPLDQVKNLIDQLADTLSVGSMQLNAYGEPLLHPNIAEILSYIRERQLPFPTFFTSHGMTLVDKKLQQLSNNYPAGIAISLHNDSQQSYEATRSQKIGDYETLVARVTALMQQMVVERAPSHLRLYQMVSNGAEDPRVDEITRGAFPNSPERIIAHVRKWEAIAREIAATAPLEAHAQAPMTSDAYIVAAYANASHGDREHLPILQWTDVRGARQEVFISARPVGTYANLLLEYDPRWAVERKVVNANRCGFVQAPSLAIFATGKLGICCLDLNSTATFGALSDFDDLHDALTSPQALRMFAQLSNGIATSKGCQICLGGSERHCESKNLPRPTRPTGHFAHAV